eukprot:TRINITY_DN1452_c0_g1_i3.p1 TRINITY_DN1452_c0_g1~~TRINITY_DN1452_c0_g1_i3.p1  ORF type:complete len:105 (-),score=10.14 TRINITY_DN1452_c0_g1_i3:15-329(-)
MQYIYTDNIPLNQLEFETVSEVMILANRFLIEQLKLLCESYMLHHISNGNVVHLLLIAIRSNANMLKERAMEFIVQNKEIMQQRPEFGELKKEPDILLEIIKKM